MNRADRLLNRRGDGLACNDGLAHRWQPLSFVFESQLLDGDGRVLIRQPAIEDGRVYVVCLGCNSHTYVVTEWAGFYLGDPSMADEPSTGREQASRRHSALMKRPVMARKRAAA
jgi:hypothetical protein